MSALLKASRCDFCSNGLWSIEAFIDLSGAVRILTAWTRLGFLSIKGHWGIEGETLGIWNTVFAEAFRDNGCPAYWSEKYLCRSETKPAFDVTGYIGSTSFTLRNWAFSWLI